LHCIPLLHAPTLLSFFFSRIRPPPHSPLFPYPPLFRSPHRPRPPPRGAIGAPPKDGHPPRQPRPPQKVEHPRRRRALTARRLVQPALLDPHDERAPQELIHAHDHHGHRDDRQRHGRHVPLVQRDAHVRPHPREPVVAVPQAERLVHHQEEPATRHREHPVPH